MIKAEARTSSDEKGDSSKALLLTRSSPKLDRAADWDVWEVDKHMYDLVRGPGVRSSTMYKATVNDRLPQALKANSRRAVSYRAPDLPAMREWLNSEVLADAVEDGRTWRDAYDPLEDQWFTGNVYRVVNSVGADPPVSSHILVERFEVPAPLSAEFGKWLDSYLHQLAALSGVEAVQSYTVVRDIRNELYLSPGNHALQLTIRAEDDPVARLTTPAALRTFRSSQDWELRLAYQTRELFTPAGQMSAPAPGRQ
jgi:hypothetical protein